MDVMGHVNIIGIVAGTCTTIAFLPQVAKVMRTKHTADISLPMYVIFSVGVFMWTCFGIVIRSLPVVIANGITLILALYILGAKLKYR